MVKSVGMGQGCKFPEGSSVIARHPHKELNYNEAGPYDTGKYHTRRGLRAGLATANQTTEYGLQNLSTDWRSWSSATGSLFAISLASSEPAFALLGWCL